MKKRITLSESVGSMLLFLCACQPPVVFDKPQPANGNALGGFPERIQGRYLSAEDNSVLQVTANSLIRIYDFDQKLHICQLDSNLQIIGDTLFDENTNEGRIIEIEGDSIVMHVYEQDTLFTVDDLGVLKKNKGHYFVNIHMPQDTWQVMKLDLSRGKLAICSISPMEDLDQLKSLTESTQDTIPIVFSLTPKQFKKFVRNEGFRDREEFWKIGK